MRVVFYLPFFFLTIWSVHCWAQVIDSHFHFFSPEGASRLGLNESTDGAIALGKMREAGIDRAVALSAGYFFYEEQDARHENDFIAQQADKFPGVIIPFCSVPADVTWAKKEIRRCSSELNMKGLKIHLSANGISLLIPEKRKTIYSLFEVANSLKLPVLIDFNKWDTNELMVLLRLMIKFPETKFILAHALFTNYRDLAIIAAIFKESPQLPRNIYVDVSFTIAFYKDSPEEEMILWYLRQFGIENVLFGSDYPVSSPAESLIALRSYSFSQKELESIFGKNFLRLMEEQNLQ